MESLSSRKSIIDYRMINCKLQYFFAFLMFGSVMPYFNVFFTSIGLTATQAGFISGLRTLASFFAGPIWGIIIDHTGKRKTIWLLLCLGSMSLMFPVPWIARSFAGELLASRINKNVTFSGNCSMNSTNSSKNEIDFNNETQESLRLKLLYVMLAMFIGSASFDLPLFGYQDSIIMNVVTSNKRKATFGSQRVFGSIGFGVGNFAAGLVADYYKEALLSNYAGIFLVFLPSAIILMPLGIISISRGKKIIGKDKQSGSDENLLILTLRTCTKLPNLVFLISIFFAGLASSLNYGFTFLFLQDELNASKTIMGLSIVVSSLAEVFIFPFSSKLIKFIGGTIPCIILGVFSYFVRFLLMSFIKNAWLILAIQSLHSVGFALFWAAAIQHIYIISPKEIAATMFTWLTGLHFGLSTVVGNMMGGYFYQKYGGRIFFRVSCFIFLTWSILMVVYYYHIDKVCLKKRKTTNGTTSEDLNANDILLSADVTNASKVQCDLIEENNRS